MAQTPLTARGGSAGGGSDAPSADSDHSASEDRALSWGERRFLLALGLPSLGLALSVTTVSSFFPVISRDLAGPALAGGLLAMEGVFALVLPSLVGAWSDGTSTRLGRRLPFVLAAGPIVAIALVLLPVFGGIAPMAGALVIFYIGYFTYFSPHFALYLDLVPARMRGRSQGFQNTLREVGLGISLVGGTAMLALGRAVPFLVAGGLLLLCTAVFARVVHRQEEPDPTPEEAGRSFADRLRASRDLVRDRPHVRRFLLANSLWETALNALRAFVVLFFIEGLGRSPGFASGVLAIVAVAALVAGPLSGWLSDRYGELPLLRRATAVYAAGAIVPAFFQAPWVLAIVPVVALAAVTVMTLPFAVLMGYLPDGEHGGASGLFGISRGLGLIAGPATAGVAIVTFDGILADTNGYGAIFVVASAAVAASMLCLRGLPRPGDVAGDDASVAVS